jgi:hypothetical protein
MSNKNYIVNAFRKILKEDLEEKAESLMNKLDYNKTLKLNKDNEFDYVQEEENMEGSNMCESCGGEMNEGETCEKCGNMYEIDLQEKENMEGSNMCESCGGEMNEGECSECGNMYEIDLQELGGMDDGHPRFGKTKFKNQMTNDEIEKLLKGDEDDDDDYEEFNFTDYDDEDNEFEDLDIETDWDELEENEEFNGYENNYEELDEKLYGKQRNIDKNKNGKIDGEDFKMLRKQQDEEEQLYEVDFEKEETDEGNAFTGALSNAKKHNKDEFEVDGKKYNVKESILFTESDLIDLIENIVNEEKKKFSVKEPKGYTEYERVHKADKKENEDYLKNVAKKMTDYLKGSSDKFSKYEMKETQKFPTENGGMKAKRKKYTPSDAVDEYIEAFSYPGQTNLIYDEIQPNDEKIKGQLVGSSTNGNAQVDKDGKALGNVVPSEVGERFYKNFKDNLYGQEQMNASYKRQPQPVDQAGEETERGTLKSKRGKKTAQSVLNKLEESKNIKQENQLNEEFGRIQQLMGYNRKTQ